MKGLKRLKSDVFLAPMAGVTDVAFRLLCKKYGAGLTFTEMISANALARGNKATIRMIDVVDEEKPRVIQLFGQRIKELVKSAKFCENKCEMIDINFGCPASKIVKQGAGSALLERPKRIEEIVAAIVSEVKVPVSCKIRLGIKKTKINVVEVAKACERSGAAMVTLHARTQKQGYTGKADWEWIKEVKDAVKIPVVGNGDVFSVEDYVQMKEKTGCDYVMVGRGAISNPFIFKQIRDYNFKGKYKESSFSERKKAFLEYLRLAKKYGVGINQIRFHAQGFTKGVGGAARLRDRLSRVKTISEIKKLMMERNEKG